MTLPCEFVVRSVLPAMRALVARELRDSYQLKQEEIASLLGITQSAVSQYVRRVRGRAVEIEEIGEVQGLVKNLAQGLAEASLTTRQVNQRYCEACQIIREKRVLCRLHKRIDPTFNVENCELCLL